MPSASPGPRRSLPTGAIIGPNVGEKMRGVLFAAAVAAVTGFATLPPGAKDDAPTFNRVASFYVCTQLDPTCNTDTETVAEIVAVTEDGYTAVYTDSPQDVRSFASSNHARALPIPPAGCSALASRMPLIAECDHADGATTPTPSHCTRR